MTKANNKLRPRASTGASASRYGAKSSAGKSASAHSSAGRGAGARARRTFARRSEIDPFIVMDVMRRAGEREAAGEKVIHMEVGQPSTPAPRAAREAAKRAIDEALLGYTDALGIRPLREAIAALYVGRYGLEISPERIVVTTGSSLGFVLAFLAYFDPGARIGLPAPGYPCYRHIVRLLGLEAVTLETSAASRWMPDGAMIARAHAEAPLDGVLIASPANPTGTMFTPEALADVVRTTEALGIRFLSDEIYHGLTYDQEAATALALSDDAIVINSFSKYYSMTGWRVGWLVVPEGDERTFERLQQNLAISVPTVSQYAALGALSDEARDELEAHRATYRANRDYLLAALPEVGFERLVPADGAFYLYADVSAMGEDSAALSERLLEEAGVAVTPGLDFDAHRGARYVRFSYARSHEDMREAIARLAAWRKGRRHTP